MPVIAVINRKGGSGKSTLATHLATWLARQGAAVMLGDVDRQQSTRAWLKRRDAALPAIVPWAIDQRNVLKVPPGVTHVVLDTPGGMHGFELAKVIMSTDAVVMPLCNSLFDRESAAACLAELQTLPRVASGRCKLGIVGMRIDARTRAAQTLEAWAQAQQVPFIGFLREAQMYVRSLDSGQTLFDGPLPADNADLHQWEPIVQWLQPLVDLPSQPPATAPAPVDAGGERIAAPRAASLMPAQEALVHGSRLSVFAPATPVTQPPTDGLPLSRHPGGLDHFSGPRSLLRH